LNTPLAFVALILLIGTAGAARAQTTGKDDEIRQLRDRIEQIESQLAKVEGGGDTVGGFHLPGLATALRIYGYAEAHVIHDVGASGPNDLFTDLSSQPLDKDQPQRGKTRITAESSRLGFETSTPTGYGSFTTQVEADFYSYGAGNSNQLRLRHAYGEVAGFLIGQTWSTFMDLDDLPETVDFNGPIGAPFSRRAQIRYSYDNPQLARFTVALEDPTDQVGAGSHNEKLPQIVLRLDKRFDRGAVNLRLLEHEKRSFSQTRRGTGVGIGGSYQVNDQHLLMLQYARVTGDVDQLYGSNGYAIDATTGAISFDNNRGLVAGWAHKHNDQLRAGLALGINSGKASTSRPVDKTGLDNKRLTQIHVGAVYSPVRNIELGGELIVGRKVNFAGDTGKMQRVDLMARYSF
jgi:hypothetical protein